MQALLLVACLTAQTPTVGERMVAHARTFLGVPYAFGGRTGETMDCMGTVFAAAEAVQKCGWKSFSVFPSTLKTDGSLGASVEGMAPVASDKLQIDKLRVGDVLMLVEKTQNPREPSIGELNGHPVWVWHMGIYSGAGQWIVGDHFAGAVVETDLAAYLKEHASTYEGLWALRPLKVAPTKCRRHAPMKPLRN